MKQPRLVMLPRLTNRLARMLQKARRSAGFSLVEISVVLVIISLLVGSIMVGTALIRSSRVNSVMADKGAYENAIIGFKDKYNALPGDMPNATDMWGYAGGTSTYSTCAALTTPSTDKTTCNGNGNESVFEDRTARSHEHFRLWQHLANAGLIEGSYSGVNACASGTGMCANPGVNTPLSKIDFATFYVVDAGKTTPLTDAWYSVLYVTAATNNYDKHLMFFGSVLPSELPLATGSTPFHPSLTPNEAWSIDDKFDDGVPGLGNIRGLSNAATNPYSATAYKCATTAVATTARYDRDETANECVLFFVMPF